MHITKKKTTTPTHTHTPPSTHPPTHTQIIVVKVTIIDIIGSEDRSKIVTCVSVCVYV